MKVLFVCFGAVAVLFSGITLLHHQEAIKGASTAEIAKLDRFVEGMKCYNIELSGSSLEPRILMD